jgi:hypothetical protein
MNPIIARVILILVVASFGIRASCQDEFDLAVCNAYPDKAAREACLAEVVGEAAGKTRPAQVPSKGTPRQQFKQSGGAVGKCQGGLHCDGFLSFRDESNLVTSKIGCPNPKVIGGASDWGKLYSCIGGSGSTVKFYINEELGTGKVESVKFMWNDWTKEGGDGVHADKAVARAWVSKFASLYAPEHAEEVIRTFFGSTNKTIETASYVLEYKYHSGPAIDGHVIEVLTKEQVAQKAATIEAEKTDFESCKAVVSKAVNYGESLLSGGGNPVRESGYKSFFITGKNKDKFFCEVHPGNKYKIKAAIGSKYPFKYIAQGNLR